MIKKFNVKSNMVLGILSLISLFSLISVENLKINTKQDSYDEKLDASIKANYAFEVLKQHRFKSGIFVDEVNDPNQTVLIGQEFTLITTTYGDLDAKLTSTNPNFAGVMVDLIKKTATREGDLVAVGITGSFPALNIALISALETLKLKPLIITSVSSSSWGATDPYFTWLDMEKIFFRKKIFKSISIAASIGGGRDSGSGLSPEGRNLILNAIKRNGIELINEEHLDQNIDRRMNIFENLKKDSQIKLYINIGGGIASLGSSVNSKLIPSGLTMKLPDENFPVKSVAVRFAERGVPIINLHNIKMLANKYGLPVNPSPLPEPGAGKLFMHLKYNMVIVSSLTLFLGLLLLLVFYMDKKSHQLGSEEIPVKEINNIEEL